MLDSLRWNNTDVFWIDHQSTIDHGKIFHPHPERHGNRVATMEVDSQFKVVEPLPNKSVYYNMAVIFFKLNITYAKYNITVQYVCVITNPSHQLSMVGVTAIGNVNVHADYTNSF